VQFSAWRFTFGPLAVMQSVDVSQTMVASLLHVPVAIPFGSVSLHTPVVS
jgi:hypothetical protein